MTKTKDDKNFLTLVPEGEFFNPNYRISFWQMAG
jgi:hypothetical protein